MKGTRALDRWLAEKDDLLAGRVPRSRAADKAPRLADLVNQFLLTKGLLRDNSELSPHTWNAYSGVCDELLEAFGQDRLLTDLLPEDFQKRRAKWAESWGPVRLGNEINRARVVFNYAHKNRLIPAPMVYGEGFKRPSRIFPQPRQLVIIPSPWPQGRNFSARRSLFKRRSDFEVTRWLLRATQASTPRSDDLPLDLLRLT